MAASRYPTAQYTAGDFVVSAGSVLFQRQEHLDTNALKVCILHHRKRNEWLLPKGRKDRGESIENAAVRETYEETGYPCELWPQTIPTRAPAPGVSDVHEVEVVPGCVEPIAVTIRQLTVERVKIIYWFVCRTRDSEGVVRKVEGTQVGDEDFESVFVDVREAVERLTFEVDRGVVRKAVEIIRGSKGE